jgi:hypothetical protein
MRAWMLLAMLATLGCRAKAPAAVPPPPAPAAAAAPASARDVSNRIVPAAPAAGRVQVSAGPATAAAPVFLADAGTESDDDRTRSVFDRYNIVEDEDVRQAVRQIEAGRAAELTGRVLDTSGGAATSNEKAPSPNP